MTGFTTYRAMVRGLKPGLLMHSTAGMTSEGPEIDRLRELAKVTPSKRTPSIEREMGMQECALAAYWDEAGALTLPPSVFRSCIETAARTRKEGPRVRRGLIVQDIEFTHGIKHTDRDDLIDKLRHRAVVSVGRNKVVRTRAHVPEWTATVTMDAVDDLVSAKLLIGWLETGGRLIGVCDWRPDKSGVFGRFALEGLEDTAGSIPLPR